MQSGPMFGAGSGSGSKPVTTRTLGPLHFEDLDPHRFEDLVRQLVYQFRSWEYLEAIGRSGDDGGVDIRGVEAMATTAETFAGEPTAAASTDAPTGTGTGTSAGTSPGTSSGTETPAGTDTVYLEPVDASSRTWLIQVKREQRFGPAQARAVAAAARFDDDLPPAGFILAVTADVSRTTRRDLTAALRDRGVGHVIVWSAGELEDMLFDPDNDHLLFAYFGISLQIRKRAASTRLRARQATKRQVFRAVAGLDDKAVVPVLLRDPDEPGYPDPHSVEAWDPADPPWMLTSFRHHHPEGVVLTYLRHHAWWTRDGTYDLIDTCSHPFGNRPNRPPGKPRPTPEIYGRPPAPAEERSARRGRRNDSTDQTCDRAWHYAHVVVPENEQAWVVQAGLVLFDDILLVDDLGDPVNGPPHLLLAKNPAHGFFRRTRTFIELSRRHRPGRLEAPRDADPTDLSALARSQKFPDPLPPVPRPGSRPGDL